MPCLYCNTIHAGMCHRVKAIDYYQDGSIKRVELHPLISVVGGATNPAANAEPPSIPQFQVHSFGQR